jgi:ketosteroid isomerase-like protein
MESAPETELLAQTERKWNQAIEENRVEEMARYMDDDWIIFSGDGNITTKKMFLTLVQNGELMHTKMDLEVLQVKIYNDTGLIMTRGTSAGTWQGTPFSHYEIASTVYIRKNKEWRAVQTMLAPITIPTGGA